MLVSDCNNFTGDVSESELHRVLGETLCGLCQPSRHDVRSAPGHGLRDAAEVHINSTSLPAHFVCHPRFLHIVIWCRIAPGG